MARYRSGWLGTSPRFDRPDTGTNRAIGSVIVGGQTLALLGTPVVYSVFDDWAHSPLWQRLRRLAPGANRRAAAA